MRVCLDCYDSLSQSKTEKVRKEETGERESVLIDLLHCCLQAKESDGGGAVAVAGAMGGNAVQDQDSSAEDDSDDDQDPSKEAHEVTAVRKKRSSGYLLL